MIWVRLAWASLLFAAQWVSAAPDEDFLGKSDGYPCRSGPDQAIGGDRYAVCSNTNWDTIFRSVKVKAPAVPRPLTLDPNPPPIAWTLDAAGPVLSVDDFLDRQPVTGMLILRGDRIVVETYQYERKPEQKFTSFSMAKTRAERQPAYTRVRTVSRRYYGYGYQTWILPYKSRTFALIGSYGQRIVIQPDSHVVIVYTSAQRTQSVQPGPFREEVAFIEGVIQSLGGNIEAL